MPGETWSQLRPWETLDKWEEARSEREADPSHPEPRPQEEAASSGYQKKPCEHKTWRQMRRWEEVRLLSPTVLWCSAHPMSLSPPVLRCGRPPCWEGPGRPRTDPERTELRTKQRTRPGVGRRGRVCDSEKPAPPKQGQVLTFRKGSFGFARNEDCERDWVTKEARSLSKMQGITNPGALPFVLSFCLRLPGPHPWQVGLFFKQDEREKVQLLSLITITQRLPWWLRWYRIWCSAGDLGLNPGSGRSPGEENGYPLQHSCLGNPMDRGVWQAIVHGVAKSRTQLNN